MDHRSESEKVICLWIIQLLFLGRREKFSCVINLFRFFLSSPSFSLLLPLLSFLSFSLLLPFLLISFSLLPFLSSSLVFSLFLSLVNFDVSIMKRVLHPEVGSKAQDSRSAGERREIFSQRKERRKDGKK